MNNRRKHLLALGLFAVFLAFFSVALLQAQNVFYGKLTGTITDDTGQPLPGVAVEITSDAIISGKRSTVTTVRGTYVFLELPIGEYKLTATLPNFKTAIQEKIAISAGSSLNFNIIMQVGTIEETVLVTATGPIVDARSSTIDSKLERAMLDKLPTSRDAFYDLSLSTPGMFDVGGAGDMPSPNAYGGTQNENVFLVNGVNTTNPRGANWGSMVQVNYDAVEEVRVVALGSKAEYGSFSGAAIDVLTKSGSNKLHGSLAFYSQLAKPTSNLPSPGANLGRSWIFMPEGGNLLTQTQKDWEANATLGGPILKDRIWFYGGFDYIRTDTQIPNWPLIQGWTSGFGDIKISAEPFTGHRAWAAYHYESNKSTNGNWGALGTDPSVSYDTTDSIHSISSQWQWLPTDKAVVTAKYLGFWDRSKELLPSNAPSWPAYINWGKITIGSLQVNGAFPWIEAFQSDRQTFQADVSYYAENFLGEHDIKFGIQYTIGNGNVNDGFLFGYGNYTYPGGGSSGNIYNMRSNTSYSWYMYTDAMRFYNRQYFRNPTLTVRKGTQAGFFFDDQWSPTKRFTVNLGLRFDNVRSRYGEGKIYALVTNPNDLWKSDAPILRMRKGTGDIFNFNDISPRIGLTYMLTADGKTVVRASYGRYYLPLTLESLSRFGPDLDPTIIRTSYYKVPYDQVDTNNNGYVDPNEVEYWTRRIRELTPFEVIEAVNDQSYMLPVAKNIKNQYTNQLTFNLERELFKDFSISASYIYRHTGNLMAMVPINRQTGQEWEYERIPFTTSKGVTVDLYSIVKNDYDGLGDGFTGADVLWISENNAFLVKNLGTYFGKKPQRTYQALQLVMNKRFTSRWQALTSFVYSWSDGLAPRSIHQGFNVEASYFYDDYWMSSVNNLANTMEGPLPFTPKYEFKLSGSYTVPYIELDLGLRFRMHSGRPVWPQEIFGPVASIWADQVPADVIVQASTRGLSTNIIAIDPKKPDYMPSQSILDLRVEKAIKLGKYGSFSLVLDAFNVFNVATVLDVETGQWGYGQAYGFFNPRKLRFTLLYRF